MFFCFLLFSLLLGLFNNGAINSKSSPPAYIVIPPYFFIISEASKQYEKHFLENSFILSIEFLASKFLI